MMGRWWSRRASLTSLRLISGQLLQLMAAGGSEVFSLSQDGNLGGVRVPRP